MRFGCCVPLASFVPGPGGSVDARELPVDQAVAHAARVLEDAGCDFIELTVGTLAPEGPDEAYESLRRGLASTHLIPECFNSFVPSDMALVGPDRDMARTERYLAIASRRVAELGGTFIIFGSGAARTVPDGYARDSAEEELCEFLRAAATHAENAGIQVAIEPLNRSETNILNSVAEAAAMAARVDRVEVGVLVDFYHLMEESEPFDSIPAAVDRLMHVHVADTHRLHPGSGEYDYTSFRRSLSATGYDDRISVECRWRDFDAEVAPSIAFLRQIWRPS